MDGSTTTEGGLQAGEVTTVALDYGQTLRLTDTGGAACCQLIAVNRGDTRERFSAPNTMLLNKVVYFGEGSILYSYFCNPMLTITATDSAHDALPGVLPRPGDRPGRDLLIGAFAELGLAAHQVPYPFLAFVHHDISTDGTIGVARSTSSAGGFVELRAELDLQVVLAHTPDLFEAPSSLSIVDIKLSDTAEVSR